MTKDDIIRMAREAWLSDYGEKMFAANKEVEISIDDITRFAALVAAHEREQIAQMIESQPPLVEFVKNEMGGCAICGFTPKLAALSIRRNHEQK